MPLSWKKTFTLFLSLFVLITPLPLYAMEGEILKGYIMGIMESELDVPAAMYDLEVGEEGDIFLTLYNNDVSNQEWLAERLETVRGVTSVTIGSAEEENNSSTPVIIRKGTPVPYRAKNSAFPRKDQFSALLADPKEPHFFVSARHYQMPDRDSTTFGAVGYGENFGLYEWKYIGNTPHTLQLGIDGALFAQFDLEAPSADLVNADYRIGIPLSYRYQQISSLLRLYHQSSHLGDEYILRNQPDRVNLSYEAIQWLLSYDFSHWRLYGGAEYMFDRDPSTLKPGALQAGAEYYGAQPLFSIGRPIAGIDLRSIEGHDYYVNTSVVAGFEIGNPVPGKRSVRLLMEWFHGYSPHGQFYTDKISYLGAGVALSL